MLFFHLRLNLHYFCLQLIRLTFCVHLSPVVRAVWPAHCILLEPVPWVEWIFTRLSSCRRGFDPRSIHVRLVVAKVTLTGFPPSTSVDPVITVRQCYVLFHSLYWHRRCMILEFKSAVKWDTVHLSRLLRLLESYPYVAELLKSVAKWY
jgi:hypothetical protein